MCSNTPGYYLNFKLTLQETRALKLSVSKYKDGTFLMDFFSVIFTVRDCLVFEDKLKAVVLTLNKCG